MGLLNTIDLRTVEQAEKENLFKATIQDNQFIVFVIMGTDAKSTTLQGYADTHANNAPLGVIRKVIWVPDNQCLMAQCKALLATSPNYSEADYQKVNAFVISPQKHLVKFLYNTDKNYMALHVGLGYWNASSD